MSCYIKDLQEKIKELEKTLNCIYNKIYCIGGPLNDNILKFNNKQLTWFVQVAEEIKYIMEKENE